MQTLQAPAAPAAPAAPGAPAAPAPGGTITIVGSDGVTKTIVLPSDANPAIARIAERAAERAATRAANRDSGSNVFTQGMAAGVALSLFVLAIRGFWRRLNRRGMPAAHAAGSSESPERLERMERGIEAIAIEVERISEGQRFVTNLLAESRQPAIPAERK